jgi:hypothetical protein
MGTVRGSSVAASRAQGRRSVVAKTFYGRLEKTRFLIEVR